MKTAPIACYCRVSTKHQKTDSQKIEIAQWLKNNGIKPGEVKWYEDKETGKTLKRPAFDQLQKSVFNGQTKTIIVWKLDRISRHLKDGINLLADWCDNEIRVVSVTQQIDLTGPVGRMLASVMFGLAEIELEYRRERQTAGIKQAKTNGVYQGRKKGTTKAKPHRAQALQKQGLTTTEIAQALNISPRTVYRYLTP